MTARNKTYLSAFGILALTVTAVLALLPPQRGGFIARVLPRIRLGLDLQGGTQMIYEADMKDVPSADHEQALQGVRDVIERRVNAFGVAEPLVQVVRGGKPRVIVELAGVHDVEAAIRQIGETPQLDFREEGELTKVQTTDGQEVELPQWKHTELTGRHLKRADVTFQSQTGEPEVSLLFDSEGRSLFADITKRNIGKRVAIFLDETPITTPVVQQAITNGEAVITGTFTLAEAKQLATRLNAGALPVPITLQARTTVGPTLGRESLAESIVAGILGIILVCIAIMTLYRLAGLVAVVALSVYGLLVFSALQALGATLTLSGVAGIILSFGMAVDANILIFERMKEELRSGRPITVAITGGFREAWPSIRDSNVASLITAALLYAFGSSVVRGFATTLAVGIVLSMFSGIVVTRVLLTLVTMPKRLQRTSWFVTGGPPAGAATASLALLRHPRLWLGFSAVLLILSAIGVAVWGLRPGIDFTGGSLIELRGPEFSVTSVRTAFDALREPTVSIQDTGSQTTIVRLRPLSAEEHAQLLENLRRILPAIEEIRFETVGPTIGRELLRKAATAVLLATVLILAYLAWAFRRATTYVSPWSFGAFAVLALLHDLLVMTGFFTILVRFRGASADSLFLTAALTLLGFSVHDTIVIFNRIHTNLRRLRQTFSEIVYRSVVETFTRSINTSATTLLVLLALYFFGGGTTRAFVATLSAGIVVGTYSSIFVASPLLALWQARRTGVQLR